MPRDEPTRAIRDPGRTTQAWVGRAVLVSLVVLSLVMLARLQGSLIYFPTKELEATPERIGLAYESVELQTEDGVRIHGWWVSHPSPRASVLFFHGNAGNISHRLDTIAILYRLGLETLIIDYRGYGRSEGTPSELGTYADGRAALRHLTEHRNVDPKRIVYFGRSLGGGIATKLGTEQPPAALILESTFTSVPDMAAAIYPLPFVRELTRIDYPNLERITSVDAPVLVVHSPDDELVPFEMGRRLFEAAPEPRSFLEIRGSHGDGFYMTGAAYLDGLDRFLSPILE